MGQISANYENIIFKFVVASIPLARPDTILSVVREVTRIQQLITCKRIHRTTAKGHATNQPKDQEEISQINKLDTW